MKPDIFPNQPNPEKQAKILELRKLAKRYMSEAVIIDGVDKEARENNLLVMEAIRRAGEKLSARHNDFFAINLGGSRVRGCNTKESDIDLSVIMPGTDPDDMFIYHAIKAELEALGVHNDIDILSGAWANIEIETDPKSFIEKVDYDPDKLPGIFHPASFENPNLNLSRLAFLEVVNRYHKGDYDWKKTSQTATVTSVRDNEHLINKLGERTGIPLAELKLIFSKDVLAERNKNLRLPEPELLYSELKNWFNQNKKDLKKYRMHDFYLSVVKELNK